MLKYFQGCLADICLIKEYIREGGFIQIFATETAVIFEALFGTRQLNFGMLHIEKSSIMIKIYKLVRKSPIWRSEAPDRQIGDFLAQKSPKKSMSQMA